MLPSLAKGFAAACAACCPTQTGGCLHCSMWARHNISENNITGLRFAGLIDLCQSAPVYIPACVSGQGGHSCSVARGMGWNVPHSV